MKIKIDSTDSLAQIRSEFSEFFPFLKIEFFKAPHDDQEPSAKRAMITADKTVSDLIGSGKSCVVSVDSTRTVSQLERDFSAGCGLNVQVFRKSGSVWLETTSTDELTLEEQNNLGKEKSTPPEPDDLTDIDYD